jgi:hypothetical protein
MVKGTQFTIVIHMTGAGVEFRMVKIHNPKM